MTPKSRADEHSRGARWVERDRIPALRLRAAEVVDWVDRLERAPALLPCDAYGWYGPAGSGTWSRSTGVMRPR